LSGFTGFLTFCRQPRTPSRPRGGTCCVFRRVRPEIRARSALTGFPTDVDNPSGTTHRIPHLQSPDSSPSVTGFLIFRANDSPIFSPFARICITHQNLTTARREDLLKKKKRRLDLSTMETKRRQPLPRLSPSIRYWRGAETVFGLAVNSASGQAGLQPQPAELAGKPHSVSNERETFRGQSLQVEPVVPWHNKVRNHLLAKCYHPPSYWHLTST
jgi:hypothetical protein